LGAVSYSRSIVTMCEIITPNNLYEALVQSETNIKLFYVDSSVVSEASLGLPNAVTAIPRTMNIHQLITVCRARVHFRDIGCFRLRDSRLLIYNCYNLQEFNFSSCLSIRDVKRSQTLETEAETEAEAKFKEAEENIIFHGENICCKTLHNI